MEELNGYDLSRKWFDFAYDNPDLIRPVHAALYFYIIEHCNRMGWKKKFGLPMEMAKDGIGVKNYRTYTRAFNDLIKWGFIKVYEKSKNQYSANVVGLVKNTVATTKALSKAMQKHSQKQVHGIVGVDKPITSEPINLEPKTGIVYPWNTDSFLEIWQIWKKYKKGQFNFTYKADATEQAALTKLKKLAVDEITASKIINESIANGWKGFFSDKSKSNGQTRDEQFAAANAEIEARASRQADGSTPQIGE